MGGGDKRSLRKRHFAIRRAMRRTAASRRPVNKVRFGEYRSVVVRPMSLITLIAATHAAFLQISDHGNIPQSQVYTSIHGRLEDRHALRLGLIAFLMEILLCINALEYRSPYLILKYYI